MRQYYVYIMSSKRMTLYVGVTRDLHRRVYEGRVKLVEGFNQKIQCL